MMKANWTVTFVCECCGNKRFTSPEHLAKLNAEKLQGESLECSKCKRARASAEIESDYLEYMAGGL